jgi:CubicO group peptidase (beta-lactamase class C family)
MMRCVLLVLLIKIQFVFTINGQGRDDDFLLSKGDLIEDLLLSYYDELGFNGSVLLAQQGEIIYENTLGLANFISEEPLDSTLPFYLASISKQFTAAAIMKLRDEGKLSLNDPITKFLPLMPPAYRKVTLQHLLTHTAGVPDYLNDFDPVAANTTNMDVYKLIIDQKRPEFTPGTKFKYSNSGYVLLALAIQATSGTTIDQFFDAKIFDPLNLRHSYIYNGYNAQKPRVVGFTSKNKLNDYNLLTVGDGGVYATARDLFNWTEKLNKGLFISDSSLQLMYQPVVLANGRERRYGYGWEIGNNLNGKFVYHTGELCGFRTYLERQLSTETTIIILTNNSFDNVFELRNTIVKVLDGRLTSIDALKN